MPCVDINFHARVHRFITASALAKATIVATPEDIPVTRCVEIGEGGPAIAASGKVDVVDQRILIESVAAPVGSNSVLHEIAEIGIFTHMPHLHDCGRLTLYCRQFKGIGSTKLGGPSRGSIGPIQVFEIVTY